MNAAEISRSIIAGNFTNEDLNSFIDAVKFARARLTQVNKRTLAVGNTVTWSSTKLGGAMTGKVKKIAIKFVTVDCGVKGSWRVPANMLTAV